jgi:hypothetical protein
MSDEQEQNNAVHAYHRTIVTLMANQGPGLDPKRMDAELPSA